MSDWISVEDELPSKTKDMVQYYGWVKCPYYEGSAKIVTWYTDRFLGYPSGATNVTHWMPITPPNK